MKCLRAAGTIVGLTLASLLISFQIASAQTPDDLEKYIRDNGFVLFRPIAADGSRHVGVIAKKGKRGVIEPKNTSCLAQLREKSKPVESATFSPKRIQVGKGVGRWKLNYSWPTAIGLEIPLSSPANTLVAHLFVADEKKYEIIEEDFVSFVNDPRFSSDCRKTLLAKKHFVTTIVIEGRLGIAYVEVVPTADGKGFDERPVTIQEVPGIPSGTWAIQGNKMIMTRPLRLAYYPKRAKQESVSDPISLPVEGGQSNTISISRQKRNVVISLDLPTKDLADLSASKWPD